MRVALSTKLHEECMNIATHYSGGANLELIPGGEAGQLLACKDEFDSFEEAFPVIERIRKGVTGYVPGPLSIYVHENNTDGFVPVAEYAVQIEQVLSKLTGATNKLARSMRVRT